MDRSAWLTRTTPLPTYYLPDSAARSDVVALRAVTARRTAVDSNDRVNTHAEPRADTRTCRLQCAVVVVKLTERRVPR